jgi:hypothetical protein
MSLLNVALLVLGAPLAIGVPYLIARAMVHQHAEQYAEDVRRVHGREARESAGVMSR